MKTKNANKGMVVFKATMLIMAVFLFTQCGKVSEVKKEDGIVLVNHLGYNIKGPKKAVFQTSAEVIPSFFRIVDSNEQEVYTGKFSTGGLIDNWHTGKAYAAIFSDFEAAGEFKVVVDCRGNTFNSEFFTLADQVLPQRTLSPLVSGVNSQRAAGEFNEKDKQMSFFGDRNDIVDVSGGWYDASGDRSKYISHLSYANYMNPQQSPMLVWNFLAALNKIDSYKGENLQQLKESILAEAVHGADWLVRMQDEAGYFYMIVFDVWSWDVEKREICSYVGQEGIKNERYQAGFREGGGMAIAALARAAALGVKGDFTAADYLRAAEKGFAHLKENNTKYIEDGQENIIDDYCVLIAATELYQATGNERYLQEARKRMNNLVGRITDDERVKGYWRADENNTRPYFHAAEAGLPLVSLARYLDLEKDDEYRRMAINGIRRSVAFELGVTGEVNNPFGYARQYVKAANEDKKRTAFFIAQNNETGYWWQGENARLASLAAAMYYVHPYLDKEVAVQALEFAADQINWILGLNPFDMCMLHGSGRNNPSYDPEYADSVELNVEGCVCNGITGGFANERDIAFKPEPWGNDVSQKWRWSEQWLPHGFWLLAAIAASLP